MRTNELKRRMNEKEDDYQEARDEEFHIQFQDMFMKSIDTDFGSDFVIQGTLTEDDVQGFLDSFDFMAVGDWCYDEVMNEEAEIGDAKYEQMKDERMES